MVPNAFIGKEAAPSEDEIGQALGPAKASWDQVLSDLSTQLGVGTREWKSYSRKAGWALRLLKGKRTIVWMSPCEGCFRVAFILGDKAVAAARNGGLSADLLKLLDEAEKYPEGNGIRLHIKTIEELPTVMKLAEIKIAN